LLPACKGLIRKDNPLPRTFAKDPCHVRSDLL
jgi:hypothetical protein